MSQAKEKFNKTIARCRTLISLYSTMKSDGKNGNQDLLRASIVLSVAALDAYVTDLFAEFFIEFLKENKISGSLEKKLVDYGVTVAFAIELLKDSDTAYEKIRSLMTNYYARYTTQRMETINQLFELYGLKNITQNAQSKAGIDNLVDEVVAIVQRRHAIVHDGDYNNSKINPVMDADINKITSIELLVNNIEDIVSNKFRVLKE